MSTTFNTKKPWLTPQLQCLALLNTRGPNAKGVFSATENHTTISPAHVQLSGLQGMGGTCLPATSVGLGVPVTFVDSSVGAGCDTGPNPS